MQDKVHGAEVAPPLQIMWPVSPLGSPAYCWVGLIFNEGVLCFQKYFGSTFKRECARDTTVFGRGIATSMAYDAKLIWGDVIG